MKKNTLVIIRGGAGVEPITKIYFDIPREVALQRFLDQYYQVTSCDVLNFEEELRIGIDNNQIYFRTLDQDNYEGETEY